MLLDTRHWSAALLAGLFGITTLLAGEPEGGSPAGRNPKRPARASRGLPTPWDLAGPPRAFEDVCFQDRGRLNSLTDKEMRRWLEPVPNQPMNLAPAVEDGMRLVRFQGMAKIRTWEPGAVLRWSGSHGPLRIHFWNGQQGLALVAYEKWPAGQYRYDWAAYRTRRPPTERPPQPQPGAPAELVLLATDDGRSYRFIDDTYEVRCQDGSVVFTKGDVRLLTAPLGSQPQAVYLESPQMCLFRDLAMCRSEPAPDDPLRPHRPLPGTKAPAKLPWKEQVSGDARFQRLPDGGVELSAGKTTVPASVSVSRTSVALHEVVLEVEEASAGTGIYLADAEDHPLEKVSFARDGARNWTALSFGGVAPWLNPDAQVAPYAGQRQWLRIVSAAGLIKVWLSGDGVHWSAALPQKAQPACWQRVGLYADIPAADGAPRRIRIRSLEIRRLDGIADLVPERLAVQAAAALGKADAKTAEGDAVVWRRWVDNNRPAGDDPAAWRVACAVGKLSAGLSPAACPFVLDDLVRAGLKAAPSREAKVALLQDAALLWDAHELAAAQRYAGFWDQLEREELVDGTTADLDLLRRCSMAASLWAYDPRIEPIAWELTRDRLFVLLAQQEWDELREWCDRLLFWHFTVDRRYFWPQEQVSLAQLVAWLYRELGTSRIVREGQNLLGPESNWQRLLAVPMNREAGNILSDLQSAAEERLFAEAARGIISAAAAGRADGWPASAGDAARGLVPDPVDPQLFTAYPVAVRLLLDRFPQVQAAIGEEARKTGRLRVAHAMAQGDAAAIEGLALGFCGTAAAAPAHQWLGDRLLAAGAFPAAIGHYEQALRTAAAAEQPALRARIRLAAAMFGQERGEPVRQSVLLGDQQVSPEQFERWIREGLARRPQMGGASTAGAAAGHPAGAAPPALLKLSPTALELKRNQPWDGDAGVNPQSVQWPASQLDWPARQLALVPLGDVLLVSNRFQVAALDLAQGKRRWTYTLGGEQGQTHQWSLVPMRPAVSAGRVYARMLPKTGRPQIVALDLADGRRIFQTDWPGDLVSDPLVLGERLFALGVEGPSAPGVTPLVWIEFDRQTGLVTGRRMLLELRCEPASLQTCQAVVAGSRAVVAVGGVCFSVDPDEQITWLRASLCVPPGLDVLPGRQRPQPPLVAGDRLYVAQMGLPAVECIDLETGCLRWRQPVLEVARIFDLAGDRLLVQTVGGITALRARDGHVLWRRPLASMCEGVMRVAPDLLACAHQIWTPAGNCPSILWIDLAGGRVKAQSPLASLHAGQPACGPMLAMANRLWCFAGVGNGVQTQQPQRDILELIPGGPAQPPDPEP
jgi:tetratricopeptide (TPR) repeat protein